MAAKRIGIAVALCVLTTGCDLIVRTTEYVDDYEVVATEIGRGECYTIRGVKSWVVMDDHHLYVEAVNSESDQIGNDNDGGAQYLVTTKSMCRGLLYSAFIEFPNRAGLVCQNESRVTYRYSELRKSCGIDNIEVVASKEAAIALVSSRTRVEEKYLIDFLLMRDSEVEE